MTNPVPMGVGKPLPTVRQGGSAVNENSGHRQGQPEVALEPVVASQSEAIEPTASLLVLLMQHRVGGGGFADVFRIPTTTAASTSSSESGSKQPAR